jgi:hypothetical protein
MSFKDKKKIILIACFLLFGIIVGSITLWFDKNTDSLFLLNIPGSLLGQAIYSGSIQLFGDPHSSQAHYTIPWILRIPQVDFLASLLFWGIAGTLLTIFLKPKVIAWIAGIYLVIFGGLTIAWFFT